MPRPFADTFRSIFDEVFNSPTRPAEPRAAIAWELQQLADAMERYAVVLGQHQALEARKKTRHP